MAGTYTELLYHLIFSTRQREPLISPRLQPDLYAYIGGIVRGQGGVLLDVGGMPDHVHLVLRIKPDISVSEIVRLVKANSSKWVNEQPGQSGRFAWQSGLRSLQCEPLPVVRGCATTCGRKRITIARRHSRKSSSSS